MKRLTIIGLILFSCQSFSQQLQDKYWIFGNPEPGNVMTNFTIYDNFNSPLGLSGPNLIPGFPTISTGSGAGQDMDLFGGEGSAVATDPITGDLFFYTDGNRLWDENHNLQINGMGGNESSTQPAGICILPKCPIDSFYVFANPTSNTGQSNQAFGTISYRMYDKISKTFTNATTLPYPGSITNTDAGEGMIVVPARNNKFVFYLISRLANPTTNNWFVVHKIDSNGVTYMNRYDLGPASAGEFFGNLTYSVERFSAPTDNVEIAVTTSNLVYTLRFNTLTGVLDNYSLISNNPQGDFFYDVEYAPNGNFLYYSTYWLQVNLFQYEFSTGNEVMNSFFNRGGGGLKKASDGYVYHLTKGVTNQITEVGRIISPNSVMPSGNMTGFYENNVWSKPSVTVALNFPEFVTIPTNGDLSFCNGVSVEQVKSDEQNINIYPNPSNSFVYIDLINDVLEEVQLIDVTGKVIDNYKAGIANGRIGLDITNLIEGVYFVTLTNTKNGSKRVGKIIKLVD